MNSDEEWLDFLEGDTGWLKRAIVSHRIREEKGRYWVDLIFTDQENPLRKLRRPIDHYPSRQKAEWHANILKRQVGGDLRDPRPKPDNDADNIRSN